MEAHGLISELVVNKELGPVDQTMHVSITNTFCIMYKCKQEVRSVAWCSFFSSHLHRFYLNKCEID